MLLDLQIFFLPLLSISDQVSRFGPWLDFQKIHGQQETQSRKPSNVPGA